MGGGTGKETRKEVVVVDFIKAQYMQARNS